MNKSLTYAALGIVVIVTSILLVRYIHDINTSEPLTVSGVSMQPTLQPGQKVRLKTDVMNHYKAGDLVAVSFKTRERKMVKRIIAIGGDEVIWKNERVFVNGEPLLLEGWPEGRRIPERNWKLLGIQLKHYENIVPKNNVIVMGDNTEKSYDSGDFGMLSLSQISGRIEP